MKINKICLLIFLFVLPGCSQKMNNVEVLGAALGSAAGGYIGSQFGHSITRLVYTTAGVLLGGSTGTLGARALQKSDLLLYQETAWKSLSGSPNGSSQNWKNLETGSAGAFRPMKTYKLENGKKCRTFRSTIVFSDAIESGKGTACQQTNGSWQIVSDDFS